MDKRAEAQRTNEKLKTVVSVLKWVGYVVGAISIVVGVLGLFFTGGASAGLIAGGISLPAAIAGLVITTTVLAYSYLDSKFGWTSTIINAVNECLDILLPGEEFAEIKKTIKAVLLVVLIIVLVFAIIASRGAAAGSIASMTTAQIAKQTAIEIARQLTIQTIMAAIMSSTVLAERFIKVLIFCRLIDPNNTDSQRTIELIVMCMTAVALLCAAYRGMRGKSLSDVGQSSEISGITNRLKDAISRGTEYLKTLPQNVWNGIKTMNPFDKNIGSGMRFKNVQDIFRMANLSAEVAGGIYNGFIAIKLAQIYRELGKLEKNKKSFNHYFNYSINYSQYFKKD